MTQGDIAQDHLETLYTYVVFSIDLVASLDGEVDQEAFEAWEQIKPQQFVGLSDNVHFWDCVDYRPLERFEMNFVLQGPLLSSNKHFITENMTIPITLDPKSHPEGRQPLTLSRPFPWKDCYHSSPLAASVLCPTTVQSSSNACYIRKEDQHAFRKMEQRDSTLSWATEIEAEENGEPLPADTPEDRRLPFEEAREHALSDTVTVVNISSDLSLVEKPASPARFFEEAAFVEQLRQEVVERKRREAEKRDAEAFAFPTSSIHKSPSLFSAGELSSCPSTVLPPPRTWYRACGSVAARTLSMLQRATDFGRGLLCRPVTGDD